jgi:phosphoglucomutase
MSLTVISAPVFNMLQALPQQLRRHLLASASAIATSTGGQAVSQAVSAGKDAVAASQANASGSGTALSVGIANGMSVVANSSAAATGEFRFSVIILSYPSPFYSWRTGLGIKPYLLSSSSILLCIASCQCFQAHT